MRCRRTPSKMATTTQVMWFRARQITTLDRQRSFCGVRRLWHVQSSCIHVTIEEARRRPARRLEWWPCCSTSAKGIGTPPDYLLCLINGTLAVRLSRSWCTKEEPRNYGRQTYSPHQMHANRFIETSDNRRHTPRNCPRLQPSVPRLRRPCWTNPDPSTS